MAERLKVLISAYACEPHRGSEPEVGWQWARHMARFHDVTVLTRSNNRAVIERELGPLAGTQPLPRFAYHDLPRLWQRGKQTPGGVWWYYTLWQRTARRRIAEMIAQEPFDLLHHSTFVTYRFAPAIWDHGVPTLWGPIGGMETYPWRLLPRSVSREICGEVLRNWLTAWQSSAISPLRSRARRASLVLAATPEMQTACARFGVHAPLFPAIGCDARPGADIALRPTEGPLNLLFAGRLVLWKGLDILIEALAASGTNARLTVVGDGPYRKQAARLVHRLALGSRVTFLGRLSHAATLAMYGQHDLFCLPSLHDSGGVVVLEAMAHGLPVICLNCGGPSVTVQPEWGIKIDVVERLQIVQDFAAAIRQYQREPARLQQHRRAAQRAASETFGWERRAIAMNAFYRQAAQST